MFAGILNLKSALIWKILKKQKKRKTLKKRKLKAGDDCWFFGENMLMVIQDKYWSSNKLISQLETAKQDGNQFNNVSSICVWQLLYLYITSEVKISRVSFWPISRFDLRSTWVRRSIHNDLTSNNSPSFITTFRLLC